jgi:hypothetical protein
MLYKGSAVPDPHPPPLGGPTELQPLYLYAAETTGVQIQNLDSSEAAFVDARFYAGGRSEIDTIAFDSVGAEAAANIYLPHHPLLSGADLGVVLRSDRRIAAMARREWPGYRGAADYGHAALDNEVIVPLAMSSYYGQTSQIMVQNTDSLTEARVVLSMYSMDSGGKVRWLELDVAPRAVHVLRLNPAEWAPGSLMWARVWSTREVAVHSFVEIRDFHVVYAFSGTPVGDAEARLYAPLVRRDYYGTTGISVVNPSESDVEVTVTFHGSDATGCAGTYVQGPVPLLAGTGAVFYQGSGGSPVTGESPLPSGCVASAVIDVRGGDVVAFVNDANVGRLGGSSAAYNALPLSAGARRVALPLVRNLHTSHHLTTGVQIMNVGAETTEARMLIKDQERPAGIPCPECRTLIAPLQTATFYPPMQSSIPKDWYGAGVIESDQPVIVIVNDASMAGTMDSAIYEGMPLAP